MLYKVSLTILQSSTGIIISSFIGIITLGIYSNFMLIVDTVKSLVLNLINPLTAIIGEINASENQKYKETIFKRLNFMMNWICMFCFVCFYILLNPFVKIWLGEDFLLPSSTVLLIVTYFYLEFITAYSTKYRDACGLNHIGKFRPLITALLNIALSLLLVTRYGINGILLSMCVSRVVTITWFEPWIVYRHVFKKSVLPYYGEIAVNTLLTCLTALGVYKLAGFIWNGTIGAFVIMCLICLIVPNIIYALIHLRDESMKYYFHLIKSRVAGV